MTEPLVSIIVPSYNAEKFLKRNLESIIRQRYVNKEVIIIDGVSSDNTYSIAEEFFRKYNYVKWFSEKDNGIYDAMNKGIRKAKGDWIYFLGADDILHNENVLTDIFSRPYSKKVGLIYGNVEFLYSKMIYNGPFNLKRILFGGNICHQAIFYKKNIFGKIGSFDLRCKIYADHDFNIRCFRDKSFRKLFVDKVIAVYNEQDGLSALERSDVAFREKQVQYINEYNRKPVQLLLHSVQKARTNLKKLIKKAMPGRTDFN